MPPRQMNGIGGSWPRYIALDIDLIHHPRVLRRAPRNYSVQRGRERGGFNASARTLRHLERGEY